VELEAMQPVVSPHTAAQGEAPQSLQLAAHCSFRTQGPTGCSQPLPALSMLEDQTKIGHSPTRSSPTRCESVQAVLGLRK